MEDLSEKNYETIKDINVNYKNEKKIKEKNNNNNGIYYKKHIMDNSMSMAKGEINYDGDYDSDYEI